MLGNNDAIVTIPVRKVGAAKHFYEGKLALTPVRSEEPSVLLYKSGNSLILVYESKFAGTNQATAVSWVVDDVEGVVRDLKAKGIAFEHYDFPGTTRQGDVHVAGSRKNAWFKDPDGNILAVVSR